MVEEHGADKAIYLMMDKKQRRWGRVWGLGTTFRFIPLVAFFLYIGPTS
jgi:hypothetical protein